MLWMDFFFRSLLFKFCLAFADSPSKKLSHESIPWHIFFYWILLLWDLGFGLYLFFLFWGLFLCIDSQSVQKRFMLFEYNELFIDFLNFRFLFLDRGLKLRHLRDEIILNVGVLCYFSSSFNCFLIEIVHVLFEFISIFFEGLFGILKLFFFHDDVFFQSFSFFRFHIDSDLSH